MNEQEQKELTELCVDIIAEKDPKKFDGLVKQVDALLLRRNDDYVRLTSARSAANQVSRPVGHCTAERYAHDH